MSSLTRSHRILFALACVSAPGNGRRIQGSSEHSHSDLPAAGSTADARKPSTALAKLLWPPDAAVAFDPCGIPGVRTPTHTGRWPTLARFGTYDGKRRWRKPGSAPDNVLMQRCGPLRMGAAELMAPLIGTVMVAGSAMKGLPQILRIARARSVGGLSLVAFYGDSMVYLTKVVYHVRREYPLSAWGELLVLLMQNLSCLLLFHVFGNSGLFRPLVPEKMRRRSVMLAVDVAMFAAVSWALFRLLPEQLLPLLSFSTAPLLLCSYSAQIWTNMRRRSTGQLAVLTVLLRWAGSLIRVLTTYTQLSGDFVVLVNHMLGVIGCTVLLWQIYWYNRGGQRAEVRQVLSQQQGLAAALLWRSLGGFQNELDDSLPDEAALRAAFDQIDTDGSGMITRDELLEAFKKGRKGNELSEKQQKKLEESVNLMIRAADEDGDGQIDFEEFCKVVCGMEELLDAII